MPMHKGAMPPLSSTTPLLCGTKKRVVDRIFQSTTLFFFSYSTELFKRFEELL